MFLFTRLWGLIHSLAMSQDKDNCAFKTQACFTVAQIFHANFLASFKLTSLFISHTCLKEEKTLQFTETKKEPQGGKIKPFFLFLSSSAPFDPQT